MIKNNTTNELNQARIRWACRRGMLELDLLLNRFLDEAYESLSDEDKTHFTLLLSHEDPDLFAWLTGQKQPPDANLQRIINKIRHHAQ